MNRLVRRIEKSVEDNILEPLFKSVFEDEINLRSKIIKSKLQRSVQFSIEEDRQPRDFNNLQLLLEKLYPKIWRKYTNRFDEGGRGCSMHLIPGSFFLIKIDSKNKFIVEYNEGEKEFRAGSYKKKEIKLTFYGPNRMKNKQKILDYLKQKRLSRNVFMVNKPRYNVFVSKVFIEDVVLKDEQIENIFQQLDKWEASRDWYKEKHLIHKIGILLYGPPGTGKTTIAKIIASKYGNDKPTIISLGGKGFFDGIDNIIKMKNRSLDPDMRIIVLIEDIDKILSSSIEFNDPEDGGDINKDLKTRALMEILDGPDSLDGLIFVATTNHIELIDEALIREGRFDIKEEIGLFERPEAIKLIKKFDLDESFLDEHTDEIKLPISPAKLQSIILKYH